MKNSEFERPDLYLYEQDEQNEYLDFSCLYEPECEPCQCCGAQIPINISVCPVCSWEYDEKSNNDEHYPSEQNKGISLCEAKLNFGVFANAYPPILWEK